MNTDRPLFKNNPKLRQAVNFALDRTAMLRVLGAASGSRHATAICLQGCRATAMFTPIQCDIPISRRRRRSPRGTREAARRSCTSPTASRSSDALAHAQIVQYDLKQIGIDVELRPLPTTIVEAKLATRGEPFDLANIRYLVAWVDPSQYVNLLLDGRTIQPTGNTNRSYFNSPHYNRLIDQAGRLSGQARYDAYGKLALDIARTAAPMATFINRNHRFFVSEPRRLRARHRPRRSRPRPGRPLPQVVPVAWTVTQTLPSPTAIPRGLFPTGIVATTLLVVGSIRETVPSPLFATQTDPAP